MDTGSWFSTKWRHPYEDYNEAVWRLQHHAQVSHHSAWKISHGFRVGRAVQAALLRVGRPLGLDEAHFAKAPEYLPPSVIKCRKARAAAKMRRPK